MMDRRRFLELGLAGAAVGAGRVVGATERGATPALAGFRHSVCRWPYSSLLSVDALAGMARELGIHSLELLEPEEWAIARRHGLECAMGYARVSEPRFRLTRGWNRVENHEWLIPAYEAGISEAAAAGVPSLICFSGNRDGLSDEAGLANCARGLREILPTAERHGVTVCMELLNSRVDHRDYQCDRTPWGVALVDRVGSPRFRLLYDIYHMQIMEGDVIRTIRGAREHIGHYHTGGVPGRNEIDGSQELHYPAIMRAIAETGFTGYVGQEFIPTREPRTALAEAIRICTV
ncbi:MAG TPA: TIM barrel protein [Gemmatimonadaceae bacterium]|nr:TIM barrel protein [Gemmatimonadaceae bacterium]